MRIVIVASNYPPHPGGLEIAVRNLANELTRRHEVVVLTTAWQGNSGENTEGGVLVRRVPAFHSSERLGIPYPVPLGPGLRDALQIAARADVIHAHGAIYPTTLLGSRIAASRNLPLILTEHVGFVQYASPLLNATQEAAWRMLGDRVVNRSHTLVTYNSRVGSWLRARYPNKPIHFVGNGVDICTFRPRAFDERRLARLSFGFPEEGRLVLFVGRLSEKKNMDAVLRLERAGFTLVVCGARRHIRAADVIDIGVVPYERMAELYGCVDLMVNVSTGEGFPLAVQEAFACGLPVVLLWDEGYDLSLDRRVPFAIDSLEELPSMLRALLGNEELRRAGASRQRDWSVRNWSWTAAAENHEALYETAARNITT